MIVTGIVRILQLLFSVIAIALSITAVRWQVIGSAPPASGYNAFAGAWGILTALLGLVAIFVSAFPGIIMAGIDFLAFIILLAGGIAYAVQVRGVDCNAGNVDLTVRGNPILYNLMNGGFYTDDKFYYVGLPYDNGNQRYDVGPLKGRCQTIIADDVFLFLACLTSLVAGVLSFMAHRRGGGRSAAV